jgi:hypothetical protein
MQYLFVFGGLVNDAYFCQSTPSTYTMIVTPAEAQEENLNLQGKNALPS